MNEIILRGDPRHGPAVVPAVRRWLMVGTALLAMLFALAACGGGGGGGGSSSAGSDSNTGGGLPEGPGDAIPTDGGSPTSLETTTAFINVAFPSAGFAALTDFDNSDVLTVIVNVYDTGTSNEYGTGTSLTLGGGVWSGSIADLPVSTGLDFSAHGYDSTTVFDATTEIYQGDSINVTLTGFDTINMSIAPIDDGIARVFPRIAAIDNPNALPSQTVNIAVDLEAGSSENLVVDFTSDPPTDPGVEGIQTPNQTPSTNGSGTVTVNTDYIAPSSVATYTQSVLVTNEQGNSVENDFNIAVVNNSTDVNVNLSPVLGTVRGKRTNGTGTVTWTATVTDDVDDPATELVYGWSYDGTATFSTDDANPGIMSGYDETDSGTITLTITDLDGGVTTATFDLPAGQFPDSVTTN